MTEYKLARLGLSLLLSLPVILLWLSAVQCKGHYAHYELSPQDAQWVQFAEEVAAWTALAVVAVGVVELVQVLLLQLVQVLWMCLSSLAA